MRKEDKYDSQKAFEIADAMYRQNTKVINDFVLDNATNLMETMYRSGYMQALQDYGIEVYPQNITSREVIEVEE